MIFFIYFIRFFDVCLSQLRICAVNAISFYYRFMAFSISDSFLENADDSTEHFINGYF